MAILTQRGGARLRSIRQQKGLSLQEVEAMSDEEFKASVLGAYERSERVISVPRLMRLAHIYGVPAEQLLPKEVEVDLTEPGATDLSEGFAVDLNRLRECHEPETLALARLVAMIQAQRQDFLAFGVGRGTAGIGLASSTRARRRLGPGRAGVSGQAPSRELARCS